MIDAGGFLFAVYGSLIGLIAGIGLSAWFFSSKYPGKADALNLVINIIMAIGVLFTMFFSLYQHQLTIKNTYAKERPRLVLTGAPIHDVGLSGDGFVKRTIEFQLKNTGENSAENVRLIAGFGRLADLNSFVITKDEALANSLSADQGFHWMVPSQFNPKLDISETTGICLLRIIYDDAVIVENSFSQNYYLIISPKSPAVGNANIKEKMALDKVIKKKKLF